MKAEERLLLQLLGTKKEDRHKMLSLATRPPLRLCYGEGLSQKWTLCKFWATVEGRKRDRDREVG